MRALRYSLILTAVVLLLSGCGGDSTSPGDTEAPADITDLACDGATSEAVTLSWTAPGDDGDEGTAEEYDMRYSTSNITSGNWGSATECTGEPEPQAQGSSESFTVHGLSDTTVYYFAIKSSDEVPNWSGLSNVKACTTFSEVDDIAPASVNDLAAGSPTMATVELTWTAPGDDSLSGTATSYDLRYSTSHIDRSNWSAATQAGGEPAPAAAGGSETFVVTGLTAGTTYYFALETVDNKGNRSDLSNEATAATLPPPDTTAPQSVSDLAAGSPTTSSIELSWTAPGDDGASGTASEYDIRYSTSAINASNWASATQCTGEPAPQAAGSDEEYTVTGLSDTTTYYFALKTGDEVPNWSDISNVPSGTTLQTPDVTAPADVGDLAAGNPTPTTIELTWTAPGDDGSNGTADQYDVRYSTSTIDASNWDAATQCTGEPAPQVAGSDESFTVTDLSDTTTYYFAIKTGDEVPNWSGLSNIPSGTTLLTPDTTAPGDVTDLAAGNPTASTMELTWTAPGDDGATGTASEYDIRYSTSTINASNWDAATQCTGEPSPQIAGSEETFTVTGLSSDTQYYYALKTGDEVPNWSDISNVPSGATPDVTAPSAVTVWATDPTSSTVELTWTSPGDDGGTGTADQYDIRYSTSTITEGNWAGATQCTGEPSPQAPGSVESYTVTDLAESTTYYFAIKTGDEVPNWSALSNVPGSTTLMSGHYKFLTMWGSEGPGDGQFDYPRSLDVDDAGNVYVTDKWNDRVQKFTSGGVYITEWGSYGTGTTQFEHPYGIAVDSFGNVYVTDEENPRIQKFSTAGAYITEWGGTYGGGNGEFTDTRGIAVDIFGNVYVCDDGNDRIQKFDASGAYLGEFGEPGPGDAQFDRPRGVAVDEMGNIYVVDSGHDRIQKFDVNFNFLTKWGSNGPGPGQFGFPRGIAVDADGYVYVADGGNHRIQKFDSDGAFVKQWGKQGTGQGEFKTPNDVAVDSDGNVYVTDSDRDRVQVFAPVP